MTDPSPAPERRRSIAEANPQLALRRPRVHELVRDLVPGVALELIPFDDQHRRHAVVSTLAVPARRSRPAPGSRRRRPGRAAGRSPATWSSDASDSGSSLRSGRRSLSAGRRHGGERSDSNARKATVSPRLRVGTVELHDNGSASVPVGLTCDDDGSGHHLPSLAGARVSVRRSPPRTAWRSRGTRLGEPGADLPAMILSHGMIGWHRKPKFAVFAEKLTPWFAVYAMDMRGHGESDGRLRLRRLGDATTSKPCTSGPVPTGTIGSSPSAPPWAGSRRSGTAR